MHLVHRFWMLLSYLPITTNNTEKHKKSDNCSNCSITNNGALVKSIDVVQQSTSFAHFSIMIHNSSISRHDRGFNQNYINFFLFFFVSLFQQIFDFLLSESVFDSLLFVTNKDVRQLFMLIENFIKINWNEPFEGGKKESMEKNNCNNVTPRHHGNMVQ